MQYSDKEIKKLHKESLKLTDTNKRKGKVISIVLFLLGIFCILYLVSGGKEFIETRMEMRRKDLSEIRVEVLNATETSGLAKQVAEELRGKGLDVLGYGNANKRLETTVIIDRRNNRFKNARLVKEILRQGKLSFESHPLQLLEVTIVLGEDFEIHEKTSIIN